MAVTEHFRAKRADPVPITLDYRSFFEASPNPYMVLDRELNYVTANRAYLDVVGARLEDLVGRNLFEAFPNDPSDPDNFPARMLRESLLRVIRERRPDSIALIPYRVRRSPSDPEPTDLQHWSATHTPILDSRGEVAFVLQHTVNVTELVRLEGAPLHPRPIGSATAAQVEAGVMLRAHVVQESNRRLYELLNQAPVAISIYRGPRHVIELANGAMCRLVNRPAEQLLGRPLFEAIPEAADQGFEERLARVRATGEPWMGVEVPVRLARGSGALEQAYLTFVHAGLRDPGGSVDSVVVIATDVTDSVRARERVEAHRAAAEEGVRLRDEFLSIASHELKTPLTAIGLRLEQLKAQTTILGDQDAGRPLRQLEALDRQVRKLAALINGLFDVSRLSTGKLEFVREPVDLAALVREVVSRYEPEAAQLGSALEVHVQRLEAEVDRLRVEQVVTNLFSNALRYGNGKPVEIALTGAGDRARLTVTDQGIGIPPEALERIFRKFERAVPSRHSGGLGLGLYLTREIVEGLGGTIRVESTVGVGSRFTVELPLRG